AAGVVVVPVEFETVAFGLHVSGMWRREVRRHQEGALLGAVAEQRVARPARLVSVVAEAAVPTPQRHLHRIVQRISRGDRALAVRLQIDADLTWRMAGRWLDP